MTRGQATLLEYTESQPASEHKGNGHRPEIEVQVIRTELQELTTAKVKVKLNKHLGSAVSIRETDQEYAIQLNPNKIRSLGKLDERLNFCRETITHYQ